jgi:mTERF domain-containing protein
MKKEKITAIIMKAPQIFQYSASNIIETIEFFQCHNLTQEDIGYMITSRPLVLTHSIDGKLKCTLDFFQNDLYMNEASWKRVIIRYPQVFSCKITHLPIRAKYLEAACGLNNKLDVSWMISAFPPVLWLSEENIGCKLSFLRDQFSFDEVELRDILVTYPQILGLSVEKNLKPKISYLLDKENGGGLTLQELKEFVLYQPALLAYSLSTRIKPRVTKMNEIFIRLSYSPPSIMSLTDTKFDAWLMTQKSTWSIN